MSYQGVMNLAREHPRSTRRSLDYPEVEWLSVVKGCYEEAERLNGGRFAGAWVAQKVGLFPGLNLLAKYGILAKAGDTVRGGRRAYWVMPDMNGAGRALRELGYL